MIKKTVKVLEMKVLQFQPKGEAKPVDYFQVGCITFDTPSQAISFVLSQEEIKDVSIGETLIIQIDKEKKKK